MPSDDERSEHEAPGNAVPAGPATTNAALTSRFHQMFPVLSAAEIDRVRRFGEVRRFLAGALLFHAGEAIPGMYVILSGRIAIEPRDGLGQAVPVAAFAQLIGAPVEEMTEVVPGEVIAEIGQLSGRPDLSVIDARAIGDVEAIVVPRRGCERCSSPRPSSASASCARSSCVEWRSSSSASEVLCSSGHSSRQT